MIYSKASEYAVRACVHLARCPAGELVSVKQIARQEHIPLWFLAKILQELAGRRLLRSRKGPTGGFTLGLDPSEIRLLDIVQALDGIACYEQCAMGLVECSEEHPCPMHEVWKDMRFRILDYLRSNTIGDLVGSNRRPSRRSLGAGGLRCASER
jgi:Rrf2 family transcriptional regulator, iron-sulfur cluster assembly transcription factor